MTAEQPKIAFKIRMAAQNVRIHVMDEHCADEMLNVMLEIIMPIVVAKVVLLAIRKSAVER